MITLIISFLTFQQIDVLTLRYIVTKTYTKNIEQLLLTY